MQIPVGDKSTGRHRRNPGGVHRHGDAAPSQRFRLRPYVTSGVVVVASSVIAVTPVAPASAASAERSTATVPVRLTAESSIANVPLNLFYALANIPYNHVQALDKTARSLFFTGNWFVGSSTNIWGSDPADPGHWELVTDLLLPFPALSNTAGHQIAMLAAAWLPVNEACAAITCDPLVPLKPITGVTSIDKTLWTMAILSGYPFPLIENLFRVPVSELLTGYTFGDIVNPAGPVEGGYGWEGTVEGPNGEPLMPWSGETFTWDPTEPWVDFWNSLTATPAPPEEGIKIPTLQNLWDTWAAVYAGLVVNFNPYVPGSPFCPGACAVPDSLTTESIVRNILAVSPGNDLIEKWLADTAAGTANGPTQEQIEAAIDTLQRDLGMFKFDEETTSRINAALADVHPLLPRIALHSGLMGAFDGPELMADIADLFGSPGVESTPPSVNVFAANESQQEDVEVEENGPVASTTPASTNPASTNPASTDPLSTNIASPPVLQTPQVVTAERGQLIVPAGKPAGETGATPPTGPRHAKFGGNLADAVDKTGQSIRAGISKITDGLRGLDNKPRRDTGDRDGAAGGEAEDNASTEGTDKKGSRTEKRSITRDAESGARDNETGDTGEDAA